MPETNTNNTVGNFGFSKVQMEREGGEKQIQQEYVLYNAGGKNVGEYLVFAESDGRVHKEKGEKR